MDYRTLECLVNTMAKQIDIVDLVSTLLDSGKIKEALAVPNEEKLKDIFRDNCWDLIAVVIEKIQDDTIVLKPSIYGACEQLLSIILEKCSAEEALLEFIERIELAKNDAQFGLVLPPLQQLLKKLSSKRGRSLEWSLNSISTYIEKIPVTEHKLEGDERKLMDSDPDIRRVIRVYSLLPTFYRPFIDELLVAEKQNVQAKQIIAAFLINLLGKPMTFIDMDPTSNERSEARLVCLQIFQDICRLENNLLKFLTHLEICSKETERTKGSDGGELSPYEHREKINMTTLSGLFYVIYSGHFDVPDMALPQVYSIEYVVQTVMLAVTHLLNNTEHGPVNKALATCKALTNRLGDNTSHIILSASVHFNLIKSLMNISIYSNYPSLRLDALNCIGSHVHKFDYKGKVMLIKYLIQGANHSGMIGYAITQYKDALHKSFKDPAINECFTGAQLLNMIRLMSHLPHGVESDLMELADQIISVLNFLTYLVLKDKDNITGIKDQYPSIETEYLETLRMALKMSRAHYQAKLTEIEEGKNLPEESVQLYVGGNILDSIPTENKKEIIQSALNGFDVIEYLVARLTEFMNI